MEENWLDTFRGQHITVLTLTGNEERTDTGTLTYVEVRTVSSTTSDYLYLAGNVRFRVSGMALKSSNFPSGGGMTPNAQ